MKKLFYLMLATLSLLFLVSCNEEDIASQLDSLKTLSTPEVFISDSGLATWDSVKHAEGYAYRINDEKAIETEETEVQLEIGDSIRVKAIGDGENYKDSKYSSEMVYEGIPKSETPPKTPTVEETIIIRYNSNGGKGLMGSQTVSLDSDVHLKANKYTRDGYEFKGWTLNPELYYVMFNDYIPLETFKEYIEKLGVSEITLYAVWEEIEEKPSRPLTIWVGAESVEFYTNAMREYAKEHGIPENQIRVVGMDTGSAADTFLTDPEAGADIFTVPHDQLGKLLDFYGNISAITNSSLISQIESNNPEAFLNVCYLQAGDGSAPQYYAAPISSQALVLYYNKDVFRGQEEKLASWEGILEVAIANNALATSFSGTDGYNYSAFLLAQPYNYAAKAAFGTQGTLQLYKGGVQANCMGYGDDQVAIHKWAQRFINDPNGRNGQISSWDGWSSELMNGKAITFIGGSWHVNNVASILGYDNYGIVELPTFTLTQADAYGSAKAGMMFHSGSYVDAKCLVKNANSPWEEHLDDIIEYLTSDEIQEKCFYETNSQPSSINVHLGDNELANAQVAQSKYGIAQPFGVKAKFNTYYYSKGAPDLYVAMHENRNGEYSNNEKILNTLQEISYIWAKGKNPNSRQELISWLENKGDSVYPQPTPTPTPTYSYHVVGGYHNDWSSYNSNNKMVEISVGELESEIRANLLDKEVKGIYKLEGRTFGEGIGWTSNAYVNGEVISLDGGYTIKVVYTMYDPVDDITFAMQWNPDPKSSAVQNLTPDTLYMPNWVETPEFGQEHLGTWVDNPVVIAGEGTYTVYFIEYAGTNSAESPKYAMALVKTSDDNNPGYDEPVVEGTANGLISYVNSSYEERAEILGILEKYAVKNNLTGLTLYENGGYEMYHPSVIKGTDTYIPGYGFGVLPEGYLIADLEGESNAAWKRYYHTYITSDPLALNYMTSRNDFVKELLGYTSSTYFGMQMNEFNDGYEWAAVQSKSLRPLAVNPESYGDRVLATKYRIEVKVGNDYRYNTLSSNSQISAFNGTAVQLEDYVTAYKILFTQSYSMYYAQDLVNSDLTIKGLHQYYTASTNGFDAALWESVGIKAYYEYDKAYLEFEFNQPTSLFNAMYFLSDYCFSPVPEAFITVLGNGNFDDGLQKWGNFTNNGLSPVDTWLSTGPYTLERWDSNQQIVFKKNPYYTLEDDSKYQIAGIHVNVLEAALYDPLVPLKEFEANNLHYCSIPADKLNEYIDDSRTVVTSGNSTFKLNFNSCTQEEWEQLFGINGSIMITDEYNYWQCEPIMSNEDFLKGISYSINRVEYAKYMGGTPTNNYLSSNYVADPELGIMFNDTEYHREAMQELTKGTEYGYNFEYAVSSFKKAAATMINDGIYCYGDTIEIEIAWMNETDREKHEYIKKYIEDAWNSANTGLSLNVVFWCGEVWSDVYYNKMMTGQYDIGFGSISGSSMDPLNFFEVLKSDNSSGFTLNWGCDTNEVSNDIYYDGMYWSFDALWEAANNGGYFKNGKLSPIVKVPEYVEEYIENIDGTVSLSFKIDVVSEKNSEVNIDNIKIFSYINGYDYMEEYASFSYEGDTITVTLTHEQLALYRDQCYINETGYVGLDLIYTVMFDGIPSEYLETVYFTWPQ